MKRIAIIGYTNIARKHIAALRANGAEIVSSCNRSDAGNQRARDEEGIPQTYTDYHEMIKQEKPDGILITVSFENIYEVVRSLIEYQIPLLVEKPSGTSLKEHETLVSLAKEHNNTRVQLAVNRRQYSVIHNAIADAGGFDAITSVHLEWSERPLYLLNERGYTNDQVAKIVFGNSIHGIDTMCWIAGNIIEANYAVKSFGDPFRWIMNTNGISDSGKVFSFNSSWDNPVPWRIVMTTQSKRYEFAPLETCRVREDGKSEEYVIEADDFDKQYKPGFYLQAKSFLEMIDGGPNVCSLDMATASMRIAQEFYDRLVK